MGLLIAPVLIVVALTGALWTFQAELNPILAPELFKTAPHSPRASADARLAAVRAAYPEWQVHEFYDHARPDRTTEFYLEKSPGLHRVAFVDPRDATVRGHTDRGTVFFEIVLDIHRTLLAGTVGGLVVETATSWGLVTLLTGLVLWWPRAWNRLRGVWTLRQGGRAGLRDLHAVIGIYALPAAALVMFTGLLFTQVWGRAWFAGLYATDSLPAAYLNPPQSQPAPGAQPFPLDDALRLVRERHGLGDVQVHLPADERAALHLSSPLARPMDRGAMLWLDAWSGEILDEVRLSELPWPTRATLYFYPLHTGSIFGWPTKILAVLVCLAIILMSVTGVLLWWKRRPPGTWGAPRSAEPAPKIATCALVILALVFPTVGASLLLILLTAGARALWTALRR